MLHIALLQMAQNFCQVTIYHHLLIYTTTAVCSQNYISMLVLYASRTIDQPTS